MRAVGNNLNHNKTTQYFIFIIQIILNIDFFKEIK